MASLETVFLPLNIRNFEACLTLMLFAIIAWIIAKILHKPVTQINLIRRLLLAIISQLFYK